MSVKQDGAAPRTAADLERKYGFGQTFAEMYDLINDAQRVASEAANAFEGLDHDEIFNRLTNYGEWQGLYRDPNGDVYFNASYIKSGKISADLIDVTDLHVYGANIIGNARLGGLIAVYDGLDSEVVGGYIGYDDGFSSDSGIGIRHNQYGNDSQVVCTDTAARMSYGLLSQVACNSDHVYLSGLTAVKFALAGIVLANLQRDGFHPSSASLTLGTSTYGWSDVYAAGTSMSELLERVEAIEAALGGVNNE